MTQLFDSRKVRFLCRRGLLELDVILRPFFEQHYEELTDSQKSVFIRFLDEPDPDLLNWLMLHYQPEDKDYKALVELIRSKMEIPS
ncbi:MAG: succinate dehydrogenase assembly factor 2 [Gammaproteobacteria bacterium]|nr:succinate dehydrogenase assembly factor 2 [Gammaproteobacteria bacterium]